MPERAKGVFTNLLRRSHRHFISLDIIGGTGIWYPEKYGTKVHILRIRPGL